MEKQKQKENEKEPGPAKLLEHYWYFTHTHQCVYLDVFSEIIWSSSTVDMEITQCPLAVLISIFSRNITQIYEKAIACGHESS